MATQDEEKKESLPETVGQETGRHAGRQIGSKIGAGAGSGAAGGSGTAVGAGAGSGAGAAGGAAGGAAAGAAGGAAGGATAGAAGGAAAGSVVPGLGTAIGAAAGAAIGTAIGKVAKYLPIAVAAAAAPILFLFLIFLVVIMGGSISSGLGGATPAEAAGSGLGLKDNYCQGYLSKEDYDGDSVNDCSKELETIINKAAAAAKMPAAILNAIGLSENLGDAMVLSDQEVLDYSAAGASIPACAVSVDGAAGPMQFMPGTFDGHKNFIIDAGERPEGYSPNPCNIEDALYAAAHKLKSDSGIPFDEPARAWTQDEVNSAASGYLGACVDSRYPDVHYCENVWQFYQNKKDDTLPISSVTAPPCGWPTVGMITTLFGEPTDVETSHSGIDIAANTDETKNNGQDVFNTMTGAVIQSDWTDSSGGRIMVSSQVNGTSYLVGYVHMSAEAVSVMSGRLNKTLNRGEAVGKTYPGALPHSTGTHLHYEIRVNSALVNPMDYTPARLYDGDTVSGPGGCP